MATSIATGARKPRHAVLIAGVLAGTFTWFTILSTGVSLARSRIGDGLLRWVDGIAGAGLLLFSGSLTLKALRDRP